MRAGSVGIRNALTHGHSSPATPTYRSWHLMVQRCTNPNYTQYRFYGAKGVSVVATWLGRGGFANFLAHMGERPEGRTVDRIDPTGNYEPGNVRWATREEQDSNKRKQK